MAKLLCYSCFKRIDTYITIVQNNHCCGLVVAFCDLSEIGNGYHLQFQLYRAFDIISVLKVLMMYIFTCVKFLFSVFFIAIQVFFFDVNQNDQLRGVGGDMGMLDTAYFLSQVILSGLMGYIVHMTGTVLSYMVTAGAMGVLSCFFAQRIITSKHDLRHVVSRPREKMRILNI